MKVTWQGHSFFEVETVKGERIVIDPYFDQPNCRAKVEDMEADLVLVTHGHYDHVGQTLDLKAPVAAIFEIASALGSLGAQTTGMNIGGSMRTKKGTRITMTAAMHSGGLPTENVTDHAGPFLGVGGASTGFVIDDGRTRLYHAGDTGLFSDMKHVVGEVLRPHVALLPIGDLFTMGPEHAAIAAQWIGARTVIPMHYNTFDPIRQDPARFVALVKERAPGSTVKVMEPGETFEVKA